MRPALPIFLLLASAAFAQDAATPQQPGTGETPPAAETLPAEAAPKAPATEPGQAASAPAPAPTPAKKPVAPKPATSAPASAPTTQAPAAKPAAAPAPDPRGLTLPVGTPEPEQVKNLAKAYFQHLLQSDARQLVAMSTYPFFLEGQRIEGAQALFQHWMENLRAKRTDLLSLYGLDVYTVEQMEAKYGPPPARLANVPLKGKAYVVVANLSGRAAVAVFREVDTMWKVVAYTD